MILGEHCLQRLSSANLLRLWRFVGAESDIDGICLGLLSIKLASSRTSNTNLFVDSSLSAWKQRASLAFRKSWIWRIHAPTIQRESGTTRTRPRQVRSQ